MKLTRIIHPVGQGGFYSETFSNGEQEATFVYDCGGFNGGKNKMGKYLKSFLPEGGSKKKIEAVFISHFHADHISGLEYLLKNAEVKYLFLPLLTEDILIEALIYNHCMSEYTKSVNSFLIKLYNQIIGTANTWLTNIIQVGYANNNAVVSTPVNVSFPQSNQNELNAWDWDQRVPVKLSDIKILPRTTMLYFNEWLYIPCNSVVPQTNIDELKDAFGITGLSVEDICSSIAKRNVNECKNIYENVLGKEHNSYSMTLYSGTLEKIANNQCKRLSDCDNQHCVDTSNSTSYCYNPNILYTGDFEPLNNIDNLIAFFNNYWKGIATIQVSHHGSKNNYDKKLYVNPINGIVSVGNTNSYNHPDIETLLKIQNQGCHPVIITEDKSSMKIYHYSL